MNGVQVLFTRLLKGHSKHCLLLPAMLCLLQGCVNVATTGAQAVYNRHSLQKNFNDQYTSMQAFQALHYKTDDFKDCNIAVSTYNSEILLAGQTPYDWQKAKAEDIVKALPHVKDVHNLLSVESPSSTLTRISDTWITTKIKAKLIASEEVDVTQVKVVTENGTVYLMGILQPDEAHAAVQLASDTDGVLNVVKLFSYVHITKTE